MRRYSKFREKLIEERKILDKKIAETKRPALSALQREKGYADSLKKKIAQTREEIGEKEAEHDQCERSLEVVAQMNANYEVALRKLRDAKMHLEKLESTMEGLRAQLEAKQMTLEEIPGL